MKIRTFAFPVAIALTVLGIGACSTKTVTVMQTVTAQASPTAPASTQASQASPTSTSSAVAVLSPGQSATFSIGSSASSQVSRMTWTMGSNVVTAPDNLQGPGYRDIAFNLTVRNKSATAIQGDPTQQSFMVWRGTDGRTDNTLAGTAATNIYVGTHGLNGQDLELMGGIPVKGYASGYVELLVPTSPGAVLIVDPNTNKTVLVINYDKLTADQINAMLLRLLMTKGVPGQGG
jgi:hypothetical protein